MSVVQQSVDDKLFRYKRSHYVLCENRRRHCAIIPVVKRQLIIVPVDLVIAIKSKTDPGVWHSIKIKRVRDHIDELAAIVVEMGADLEFAVLGGADISGASFVRANLKRANFVGTKGHGADFSESDLYYSRPGNADFRNAIFRNANIQRTIFRKANLEGADFRGASGAANFENANIEGIKK